MKIALLVRMLYPSRGAEETIRYLFENLGDDHHVRLFGFYEIQPPKSSHDIIVKALPDRNLESNISKGFDIMFGDFLLANEFRATLSNFSPDLVISQHELSYLAYWLRLKQNIPYIIFLHDKYFLQKNPETESYSKKFFFGVNGVARKNLNKKVLYDADLVVSVSEFINNLHKKNYPDIDSTVVFPFVTKEKYQVDSIGNKILHVGPTHRKGIDITLNIAKEINEEFIIVGEAENSALTEIGKLDNVTHFGYVDDMRRVYSQTGLVLQPSRCDEAFGRVPIEAGMSGIPTIAADHAGLPEAVNCDELLIGSYNHNDYIDRIQEVKNGYERYSDIAYQNAQEKNAEKQFEKFINTVESSGIIYTPRKEN